MIFQTCAVAFLASSIIYVYIQQGISLKSSHANIQGLDPLLKSSHADIQVLDPEIKYGNSSHGSNRHRLPGNSSYTGPCSCGGWTKWYMHGGYSPSCCLRQTAETFLNLVDFFERENVSYSPKGGGLVGIVRCGSLTSYEYDFDIIIFNHTQRTVEPLMKKWVKQEKQPGGLLTLIGVTVGGLKHIRNGWGDFNARTPRGDVHLDFEILETEAPPLRPCSLYGRIITCFDDANVRLSDNYGKNWMTPLRWTKHAISLSNTTDKVEQETCILARQEMRDGPACKTHPDLHVGAVGCSGSDADENY